MEQKIKKEPANVRWNQGFQDGADDANEKLKYNPRNKDGAYVEGYKTGFERHR